MMIPEAVRLAALFPMTDLPPPPPEHPFKQVIREGYAISVLAGLSYASVTVQAIARDGVERAVADVRDVSSEHGMVRTAWFVPEAARPEGLAASLRAMGMAPYDQPPLEPRYAAMAIEPSLR